MCGIIGVANLETCAVPTLFAGLLNMQHRGKESAGVVTHANGSYAERGGMGEVHIALDEKRIENMPGRCGIGHTRYSNAGASSPDNRQPLRGDFRGHGFYLGHNGSVINVKSLGETLSHPLGPEASDTRTVVALLSNAPQTDFESALIATLARLQGAFNFLILFEDTLYAAKDAFGFHPLQIGTRGGDVIIASESCVFDHVGACFARDIMPGELVTVRNGSITSSQWTAETRLAFDIFEYIYFLRPDSVVHGVEAGAARYHMGRRLAKISPRRVDAVIPVADSGNEAALGYWETMTKFGYDISFRPWALFRPHTTGRTFIEPVQKMREEWIRRKFNPRPSQLRGARVLLIDDSIVRGNTLARAVRTVRAAGASAVFAGIASDQYRYPDFYGIDTYRKKDELIARRFEGDAERICGACGLDGLAYLPHSEVIKAVLDARAPTSILAETCFYDGPFTGRYPAGMGSYTAL
ncbi:MAG: amidophosphoribosyltransferase [Parcubacteria group bacterium]|nr:amidophosphoribosyltransferase [Parcubacteria group bacterium]